MLGNFLPLVIIAYYTCISKTIMVIQFVNISIFHNLGVGKSHSCNIQYSSWIRNTFLSINYFKIHREGDLFLHGSQNLVQTVQCGNFFNLLFVSQWNTAWSPHQCTTTHIKQCTWCSSLLHGNTICSIILSRHFYSKVLCLFWPLVNICYKM